MKTAVISLLVLVILAAVGFAAILNHVHQITRQLGRSLTRKDPLINTTSKDTSKTSPKGSETQDDIAIHSLYYGLSSSPDQEQSTSTLLQTSSSSTNGLQSRGTSLSDQEIQSIYMLAPLLRGSDLDEKARLATQPNTAQRKIKKNCRPCGWIRSKITMI